MPLTSVPETVLLRFRRELVKHVSTSRIITTLVRQDVGSKHTSMCANTPIWECLFFQKLHEIRTRDIQQVSGLLCGQLGMQWQDGHGISVRHLAEDLEEEIERLPRNRDGRLRVASLCPHAHAGRLGPWLGQRGKLPKRFLGLLNNFGSRDFLNRRHVSRITIKRNKRNKRNLRNNRNERNASWVGGASPS